MCGITGFTGKPDEAVLKRMSDAIVHRGPDDCGYYCDGKINLGIRRLSILDIQSGKQPMHNEDKSLWTVFNGEIYNYVELRTDLQKRGHVFYTHHSDTELIVHLYEEYGLNFPDVMNGMFAIALWDKNREKLILVRDRLGVKPLFYTIKDGMLVFGSEIKALLSHPICPREMNPAAIYHYLTLRNIPSPMTAFDGIYSLPPAAMLVFEKRAASIKKWWKVRYSIDNKLTEDAIQEQLLPLLEDATKIRMRSDVPYGAYLSGGVDSSSIVSIMTRFSQKPVKTFALGYTDELSNKQADIFHARRVHEFFKTEHYEYIMSHQEIIDNAYDIIRSFDQPFSGTVSTYFLSKLIKQHVKVALSGDGADELFGSYLSHRTAQPMYHFARLHEKYKSGTLDDGDNQLFMPCDRGFLSDLFERSGGSEPKWRYFLYLFTDEEKRELISEKFRIGCQNVKTYDLIESYFADLTAEDPLNRMLEMELATQFPDQVLAFVDFLSMAHSVEVRSPFIDYRIVEFAATIPGYLKIRNGNVKDILKRTVRPLLPDGIAERRKEGFVLPIYDWMVEKLRPFSEDILSENRLNRYGILNPDKVKNILTRHYSGSQKNPAKIWTLMNLQIWCELYLG